MPKSIDEINAEMNLVFSRFFKRDDIVVDANTTAADVEGWDSLTHMQLIAELEKHFGTKFSLREIARFQNVGDICRVVQEKIAQR
jgi:acyl carrier protein